MNRHTRGWHVCFQLGPQRRVVSHVRCLVQQHRLKQSDRRGLAVLRAAICTPQSHHACFCPQRRPQAACSQSATLFDLSAPSAQYKRIMPATVRKGGLAALKQLPYAHLSRTMPATVRKGRFAALEALPPALQLLLIVCPALKY